MLTQPTQTMNATLRVRGGSRGSAKAYKFLCEAEADGKKFDLSDLVSGLSLATGWKTTTVRQYLSGRLRQFVRQTDTEYRVQGCKGISASIFDNLMSQNVFVARAPLKPSLSAKTEELVSKAQETALAAVQHYNNPLVVCRTGTFVILMLIAFTALFHAVFERNEQDYREYKDDHTVRNVGSYEMLWDVLACVSNYTKLYGTSSNKKFLDGLKINLTFFKPLRDRFEHRDMPFLDGMLGGECQSMLMNFECLLTQEFTSFYSLNTSLVVPLHFSTARNPEAVAALKSRMAADFSDVKKYINEFRVGLTDEMITNPAYAFRVWLVPKPANEARRSDAVFETVKIDVNDPQQGEALSKAIALLKPISVSNAGWLKPARVSQLVGARLGRKFTHNDHVTAWKLHKPRPATGAADPFATIQKYCRYDEPHGDYVYSTEWVEFLVATYSTDATEQSS